MTPTAVVLAGLIDRLAAAELERDEARAECERLRACCDELRAITIAADDPRINNTITLEEWARKAAYALDRYAAKARGEK